MAKRKISPRRKNFHEVEVTDALLAHTDGPTALSEASWARLRSAIDAVRIHRSKRRRAKARPTAVPRPQRALKFGGGS